MNRATGRRGTIVSAVGGLRLDGFAGWRHAMNSIGGPPSLCEMFFSC